MSDKSKSPVSDLVEQAMQNYEQALETGLKFQEEAVKCWTDFMNQATGQPDWQKRWKGATAETIPILQKRMEDTFRLMEQSGRTSLELLQQALEVSASDSAESAQGKVQELWEASLRLWRNNAQSITQANAKVVESWMQLFTRATTEAKPKGKAA